MQELIRGEKAVLSGVICHLHLKEQRDKIGSINYMGISVACQSLFLGNGHFGGQGSNLIHLCTIPNS